MAGCIEIHVTCADRGDSAPGSKSEAHSGLRGNKAPVGIFRKRVSWDNSGQIDDPSIDGDLSRRRRREDLLL